jgi:hypothetical protein
MKNFDFGRAFAALLPAVCVLLGACSTGENAAAATMKLFGGSSRALLFEKCKAVSEDEIEFVFSAPVTVKSLVFQPELAVASIENGSTVRVKLEESPQPGLQITADILAEDANRNTINVIVPLRTRNNRMPRLVINELCTEYTKPKTEFIEFRTLSAGNLGGMRVFILGNSNASKLTIHEFAGVEVKANEYITLHLRTVEEEAKNEYGEDLSESGGKNASDTARDFWLPGNTKLIQTAASVVYVLDQDDKVLDAVMISKEPGTWWQKDYFAEAAEFLLKEGAWKSANGKAAGPADAVNSSTTTNTRTICRDETVEDSQTAADWYITATSNATPGKANSEKRYSN